MSIDEKIAAIRAAKTTPDDYEGKRITELEDTVLNSADELKARFDANVEDVLDPAHNELCEATAQALEEQKTTTQDELAGNSEITHTHAL